MIILRRGLKKTAKQYFTFIILQKFANKCWTRLREQWELLKTIGEQFENNVVKNVGLWPTFIDIYSKNTLTHTYEYTKIYKNINYNDCNCKKRLISIHQINGKINYIYSHNFGYASVKLTSATCMNISNSQKHNAFK